MGYTEQLAELKRKYEERKAAGASQSELSSYSKAADELRAKGADEGAANKIVYGKSTGYYEGWQPSSSSSSSSSSSKKSSSSSSSKKTYPVTNIYDASGKIIGKAEIRNGVSYIPGTNQRVTDVYGNAKWKASKTQLPGGAWGTIIVDNTPESKYVSAIEEALKTAQQPFDMDAVVEKVLGRIPKMPEPPPTLSYQEAQKRAKEQLNPLYNEALQEALKQVDLRNIQRGFFGQLPGAALSRSTAADIETKRSQAIGQLANQLAGQSEEAAAVQQQLAIQQRGQEVNAILEALRSAQSEAQNRRSNLVGLLNSYISALQWARASQQNQKEFEESKRRWDLEWPYLKQQYEYQLNKPYYSPNTGSTVTGNKNYAINALASRIHKLKNNGKTKEEIKDILYSSSDDLGENISIMDALNLVDQIFEEGTSKSDVYGELGSNSDPAENVVNEALKARPWWQKLIDLLPGEQYR